MKSSSHNSPHLFWCAMLLVEIHDVSRRCCLFCHRFLCHSPHSCLSIRSVLESFDRETIYICKRSPSNHPLNILTSSCPHPCIRQPQVLRFSRVLEGPDPPSALPPHAVNDTAAVPDASKRVFVPCDDEADMFESLEVAPFRRAPPVVNRPSGQGDTVSACSSRATFTCSCGRF